jgi:phosphoribosylanthranilate isomerase
MFRIKICGITSAEDAAEAASLGADAIGINFYKGSKRYVPPGSAPPIVSAVRGRAAVVGLFVNEAPETIGEVCMRLGIDIVQLAGDESPSDASRIAFRRIKVVRLREGEGISSYRDYPCESFLLDAYVPGEYGGTGKVLDWERIGTEFKAPGKPWFLAGGLTPQNVTEAILLARPDGVDVAGGVEIRPGKKDYDKLKSFIHNARKGFDIAGI